jgi:hypothetical protein
VARFGCLQTAWPHRAAAADVMRWRANRKKSYLEERYEVVMHNYTFMRLLTLQPSTPEEQVDCNAFLESFGVHARNLVEFLSRLAAMSSARLTFPTSRRQTKHPAGASQVREAGPAYARS